MRFLLEPPEPRTLDDLLRCAEAALASGLDGVLLREWAALPGSLVSAAAVAARVEDVLVAAEVEVGRRHPVEIAEEAAVTDLTAGGRLILVVRPAPGAPGSFVESLDVIRHAFSARPFDFLGEHWQVPANLPQNVNAPDERIRVTPAPAQPRLEVWGVGPARSAALERALGHLADLEDDDGALASAWRAAERFPASIGAPRARRERWDGPAALVGRLRRARDAWGQDWACVVAPAEAAPEIGSLVRPRVQLHRLPAGLEQFWDEERPWQCRAGG